MLRNNRILFKSGGIFKDFSAQLSDVHGLSQVINYIAPGDFLYFGSDFPFNHKYFDVKVANDQASTMTLELWTGNGWTSVVDILDETASAGKPFSKSGIVSWQPDLLKASWLNNDTFIMIGSGLETLTMYGLYWLRMSFSASLKNTTEFNYIGHLFSADPALEAEYPDLAAASLMTAWAPGKTDWKEQALIAAEYIIQDLRGIKDIVTSPSQILDWRQFEKASIHKTAEIIFRGFGADYKQEATDAMIAYKKALSVGKFNVDLNQNANLDYREKMTNSSYGTR